MKRCYKCKFFGTIDSGYSVYTVCGTDMICLKNQFEPTEESYSWRNSTDNTQDHEFFKRAESCQFFAESETQYYQDAEYDDNIYEIKDEEVLKAIEIYNNPPATN